MVEGADVVTLVNALLGTTAILSLVVPLPVDLSPGAVFVLLITVGLVFDGLDGLVARRFGMSRAGRMLDSLSDAITFGLAPAAFILHRTDAVWLLPALLVFMGCAMYRLALFTTLDEAKTVFNGLPSPVAGITLLLAAILPASVGFSREAVAGGLAVVLGVLMVSGIRYPKIRGRYQPMLVVFALLALAHLVVYFAVPGLRPTVVASGLVVSVGVVVFAPAFADRLEEE